MFMCVLLHCKYKNNFKIIVAASLRCDRISASVDDKKPLKYEKTLKPLKYKKPLKPVKTNAMESRNKTLGKLDLLKKGHPQWRKNV